MPAAPPNNDTNMVQPVYVPIGVYLEHRKADGEQCHEYVAKIPNRDSHYFEIIAIKRFRLNL
jgi:hypothetical protein